jgi:hypothetical protein
MGHDGMPIVIMAVIIYPMVLNHLSFCPMSLNPRAALCEKVAYDAIFVQEDPFFDDLTIYYRPANLVVFPVIKPNLRACWSLASILLKWPCKWDLERKKSHNTQESTL